MCPRHTSYAVRQDQRPNIRSTRMTYARSTGAFPFRRQLSLRNCPSILGGQAKDDGDAPDKSKKKKKGRGVATVIGTFLIVAFLASLAGCDKLGLLGKSDQSGHSHSHE